jgi:lipoprotein NlpD
MLSIHRVGAVVLIVLVWTVGGCVNKARAPIAHKSAVRPERVTVHRAGAPPANDVLTAPASYVVRGGDTLYSVAWRFGIDFRSLSHWNRISDPNVIYVGQRLRLTAPPKTTGKRASAPTVANAPKRAQGPTIKPVASKAKKQSIPHRVIWSWPASGAVQAASTASGTKGIEISGSRGDAVKSAAGGTVVYSGSGLRGYGQLIIVKHSEEFLSAYAHNDHLLVGEGAIVKRGQQIAEMGNSDAKRVMLHFEIRRDGKAVEPLRFLPQR